MGDAEHYFELSNRLSEIERKRDELTKQRTYLFNEKLRLETKLKESLDDDNNIIKIPNNENYVIFLNKVSVQLLKLKQI
jgi:predicted transcriptional regulator